MFALQHPLSFSSHSLAHRALRQHRLRLLQNLYLAGFCLTLIFVIRRILSLLDELSEMEIQHAAALTVTASVDSSASPEVLTAKDEGPVSSTTETLLVSDPNPETDHQLRQRKKGD